MAQTAAALLKELAGFSGDFFALQAREKSIAADAKALDEAEQMEFVLLAAEFLAGDGLGLGNGGLVQKAASAILRRKLTFRPDQVLRLVKAGANPSYYFPFAGVVSLAEKEAMTPELRSALDTMRKARVLEYGVSNPKQITERIDALLAGPAIAGAAFEAQGAWSEAIAAQVDGAWRAVLEAGAEIAGSDAPAKWRAAAERRMEAIGREAFRERAIEWLQLGPCPGVAGTQISSGEAELQRGLLWSLTSYGDAATCAAIAWFAEQCLRKIPMVGPVAQRSGNACVKVLASMPGMEPISQLARLALRVKYQVASRMIQEALEQAAQKQGLSREELEEITVPSFGLEEDGTRREQLGETTAVLDATGSLAWFDAAGKAVKSVPASVKQSYAAELKELRDAAKEIERMRAAHRIRLERLLLADREIPLERWRDCCLNHGLIGDFARRLIWQLPGGETAIWHEGRMVSWNGQELEPTQAVRLWHPLDADVQTVMSWRAWLEDHRVQQPFKQAHREVYLLTDAERETQVYSNRFAAHILKQHQFHALCEQRGWRYSLMGAWDSHNNPYLELPAQKLRAVFHVDFPPDGQTTAHGIYLYTATDQVAFYQADGLERLPLDSIPARVLSEVMRDVDLFVGVASIAADPTWGQQTGAPFAEYWAEQSFGELSSGAQQRRAALAGLVPKLGAADRLRVEDRFLHVRGKRAEYKIHLGSGNVMMEPGSRYLCIVQGPAGDAPANVFLPFEGDRTLALILSKALLLLDESKIKDPTILRQLA